MVVPSNVLEDPREQQSSIKFDRRLSPRNLDLPMLSEDQILPRPNEPLLERKQGESNESSRVGDPLKMMDHLQLRQQLQPQVPG